MEFGYRRTAKGLGPELMFTRLIGTFYIHDFSRKSFVHLDPASATRAVDVGNVRSGHFLFFAYRACVNSIIYKKHTL